MRSILEPKPTVQPMLPTVASVIASKGSDVSAIERETGKDTAVGEAVGKTVGQPTVQWAEPLEKTPLKFHNRGEQA